MIKKHKAPPRPAVANKEALTTEPEIIQWLKYHNVQKYNIQKTEKGLMVNVAQTVRLLHKARVLPFAFGVINGNFDCRGIGLESLKNSPQIVKGSFNCSDNFLTTLQGAPLEVEEVFRCDNNQLENLSCCPQTIKELYCCNNHLNSLEGAPKKLHSLIATHNKLTNLKGCPEIIDANLDCSFNNLSSLEGGPERTWNIYNVSHNALTSLKGGPVSTEIFSCNNNLLSSLEFSPQYVGIFNCSKNLLKNLEKGPIEVVEYYCLDSLNDMDLSNLNTNIRHVFFLSFLDNSAHNGVLKSYFQKNNDTFSLRGEQIKEILTALYTKDNLNKALGNNNISSIEHSFIQKPVNKI